MSLRRESEAHDLMRAGLMAYLHVFARQTGRSPDAARKIARAVLDELDGSRGDDGNPAGSS